MTLCNFPTLPAPVLPALPTDPIELAAFLVELLTGVVPAIEIPVIVPPCLLDEFE